MMRIEGIVMDDEYAKLPGSATHELPPLLIRSALKPSARRVNSRLETARQIVESEDLMAPIPVEIAELAAFIEQKKFELALQLAEGYNRIVGDWQWGDSIMEWIRQCQTTFEMRSELCAFLDTVWPHAGQSSFVRLLEDKAVVPPGSDVRRAVGMRLAFRLPPPIACCSNQFLLYLGGKIARTAYNTWKELTPPPVFYFPPERFHFQVVYMGIA